MWPLLIQAAIPLGVELVQDIEKLMNQESAGTVVTPAQWNALQVKWATKQAEQYAKEAIAEVLGQPAPAQ